MVQQQPIMTFRLDFQIRPAEVSFRVNDEGGPVPVHCPFIVALSDACRGQKLVFGIRQQVDSEPKLVAEAFV